MHNSFGKNIRINIFGESHGKVIGGTVEGLPPGFKINMKELNLLVSKRRPGQKGTTKRVESDEPIFLSGIREGILTGSPLAFIIKNEDVISSDYIIDIPRPSHADLNAYIKYKGYMDLRGGGPFSGRLTAPLVIIGGICMQVLEEKNIFIYGQIRELGDFVDRDFKSYDELKEIKNKAVACIDDDIGEKILKFLEKLKEEKDSIGGKIRLIGQNLPIGLGEPNYRKLDAELAHIFFSIPGVKAVEFGAGFESAKMRGSEYNDEIRICEGRIKNIQNNSGGVIGGMANGMDVVADIGIKPTPSIGLEQRSISLKEEKNTNIVIKGRHDPSIVLRIVPVLESVMAIKILDLLGDMDGYK